MKFARLLLNASIFFCLATAMAEAAVLGVLWKRGQLTPQTAQNLLVVAYDIPVRDMYSKLQAKANALEGEMLSFSDLENARLLTSLDLDLREMSAEKGLIDLHDLDLLLGEERKQYLLLKDGFDQRWQAIQKNAQDSELQEVRRQIESLAPNLAKDQLLRILDDTNLDPDRALNHVVTIFKSLPVEKRRKLIAEFRDRDSASLHEILRQIRLGTPEINLIRETRAQLEQFGTKQ